MVLVVLGATAAIVVAALPSTSSLTLPTSSTTSVGGGTTTSTSRTIVSAAVLAECVADVGLVQGAASAYATINGTPPPAGTAWATAAAKGGPYLHAWPSAPGQFSVRWSGAAVVVTPVRGRASTGSAGTATPPTGCYAA